MKVFLYFWGKNEYNKSECMEIKEEIMMNRILFLEPVMKEAVWGGEKLRTEFGYQIPSRHTGECWAVSAHNNGDCRIKNGEFAGKTLSWLWENRRDLFGDEEGEVFPLLIKIIDAKDDLSIQVHPDDAYAKCHENGSLGKTECWYVLDCEENAEIVVGHNAKTKNELISLIQEGRFSDLICVRPVQKGDFFQIEPGTVHAIKGGTLIFETQQSSDITYRLYDYDRRYHGELRELHLDKSIDVIKNPYQAIVTETKVLEDKNSRIETLVECQYYTVCKLDIQGPKSLPQEHSFQIFSVIEGAGSIDDVPLKKGDHFILPYQYGEYTLCGQMSLITSFL